MGRGGNVNKNGYTGNFNFIDISFYKLGNRYLLGLYLIFKKKSTKTTVK